MGKREAFRKWLQVKLGQKQRPSRPRGGIEIATPSYLKGWIYDPMIEYSEVRVIAGQRLIGRASIGEVRPDVMASLGISRNVGFTVELAPTSSQDPISDAHVVALTIDGDRREEVGFIGKDLSLSSQILHSALSPEVCGLDGHFDGITASGEGLHGWCFNKSDPSAPCTVYLHTKKLSPLPIPCNVSRLGFGLQGYPESCGFYYSLASLVREGAEIGDEFFVSFDSAGLLRLPANEPCVIPDIKAREVVRGAELVLDTVTHQEEDHVISALEVEVPDDLVHYWRELEQFKQYCDQLESELDFQESLGASLAQSLPSQKSSRGLLRLFGKSSSGHLS